MNPFLPKPEGRLKFSLNPVTMLSQLCGKKFKSKICCAIIIFFVVSALVFILPSFLGSRFAVI